METVRLLLAKQLHHAYVDRFSIFYKKFMDTAHYRSYILISVKMLVKYLNYF